MREKTLLNKFERKRFLEISDKYISYKGEWVC
jgi:hypothetical protein